MVLRVAAARDPKTLAVWRLIWAVVASIVIAGAAHPAANAALSRYKCLEKFDSLFKHVLVCYKTERS